MSEYRFEPVETVELGRADGDVAIKGWDEAAIELTVDGSESECSIEVQEQTLAVSCRAPFTLRVPRSTVVQAQEVAGDLLVSGLDRVVSVGVVHGDAFVGAGNASVSLETIHGDLGGEHQNGPFSVTETHGDLHLKHVSAVRAGSVHGDVYARDVAAEVELSAVRGDVRLRGVAGAASLEDVQGDLRAQGLAGGLTAHQVQGSVSLKTDLTPGCTYRVRALGDVSARFPPETSARFILQAQGEVSVKGFEVEEQASGQYAGQSGEGEAEVMLEAEGSISVKVRGSEEEKTWGFSLETLGAEIEAQVATEIEAHMGELDHAKIASREIEKVMRQVEREIARAQEQAQRATERAQERARRAEERARQAQEKALKRAQKLQAKVDVDWQPRGRRHPGTHGRRSLRGGKQGASSEEQAAILNMLQAGKITVEDAEELLNALGG